MCFVSLCPRRPLFWGRRTVLKCDTMWSHLSTQYDSVCANIGPDVNNRLGFMTCIYFRALLILSIVAHSTCHCILCTAFSQTIHSDHWTRRRSARICRGAEGNIEPSFYWVGIVLCRGGWLKVQPSLAASPLRCL